MIKRTALITMILMLCIMMAVGGTLAYFSDAAAGEEAVVQFGTLAVKVEAEADEASEWLPRIRWKNEDNAKGVSWKITNEGTLPVFIRADLKTQLTSKLLDIPLDDLEHLLIEWINLNQAGIWQKESDGLWYYSQRLEPEESVDLAFEVILTRVGGVLGGRYTLDLEVEATQALENHPEASWEIHQKNME